MWYICDGLLRLCLDTLLLCDCCRGCAVNESGAVVVVVVVVTLLRVSLGALLLCDCCPCCVVNKSRVVMVVVVTLFFSPRHSRFFCVVFVVTR